MTTLGKILVFVNLALALVFAFWGLAIYTNRVDFTNAKGGLFAERKAEIDQIAKGLGDGINRRELAARTVAAEEARRPVLEREYGKRLETLRTGDKNQPILGLQYVNGVLQVDAQGLPVLGPIVDLKNQPVAGLASIKVLNQEYADTQKQVHDTVEEIGKLVKQEQQLTKELAGEGPDIKGLRGTLALQLQAEKNSLDEQEFLKPILYNRQAELEILVKRRKALEARLKELQGARVAQKS
jgi:hypothetical protein